MPDKGMLGNAYQREMNKHRDEDEQVDIPSGWREPTLYLRFVTAVLFWGAVVLGLGYALVSAGNPAAFVTQFVSGIGWMLAAGWVVAWMLDFIVAVVVGDR